MHATSDSPPPVHAASKSMMTVQQHILEGQRTHPTATGEFSWLLSGVTLATKIISAQIRNAGLIDLYGRTGDVNVQGEVVQKLDMIANEMLVNSLAFRGNVSIIVSEEDREPRVLKEAPDGGDYIVLFDPLDGSSNIDVNVSVGTIFSILHRRQDCDSDEVYAHVLQPGYEQVAAGYVVYGSSTVLAYTTGHGVHMFTLDPSVGAYMLCHENVRMPSGGRIYSVNEAYRRRFPKGVQNYLDWVKSPEAEGYTSRYIGSLVADFHRTLLRGGVFIYPPTDDAPQGKLRLLYEANPLAFIVEQAGGMATDGRQRILDKVPRKLHERPPLIIGEPAEVEKVRSFWKP